MKEKKMWPEYTNPKHGVGRIVGELKSAGFDWSCGGHKFSFEEIENFFKENDGIITIQEDMFNMIMTSHSKNIKDNLELMKYRLAAICARSIYKNEFGVKISRMDLPELRDGRIVVVYDYGDPYGYVRTYYYNSDCEYLQSDWYHHN